MSGRTVIDRYHWRGGGIIPVTASADSGRWTKAITGAAPPTAAIGADGSLELALTSAVQIQNVCVYLADKLVYDIDNLIRVTMIAKISASLGSAVSAIVGLGSARNDDPDAMAAGAWFKLAGSNALVCETDDGSNNLDDKAAGFSLAAAYKRLTIDFATGIKTVAPPGSSIGGKGNVLFQVDNDQGHLRRAAVNQQFDMSAYSAGLQPIFQIQKTSDAATGTLNILELEVEHKLPLLDA